MSKKTKGRVLNLRLWRDEESAQIKLKIKVAPELEELFKDLSRGQTTSYQFHGSQWEYYAIPASVRQQIASGLGPKNITLEAWTGFYNSQSVSVLPLTLVGASKPEGVELTFSDTGMLCYENLVHVVDCHKAAVQALWRMWVKPISLQVVMEESP